MTRSHSPSNTDDDPRGISSGWRAFQILGLLSALSWLASYTLFVTPFQWVGPMLNGTVPAWGDVVFDFSPFVSIVVILLTVAPGSLGFTNRSNVASYAVRTLVLALPVLWMLNVFIGTPMVTKLFAHPLEPSRMVPIFAGVFVHVVFQHWFQAIAALGFALAPTQFEALTGSQTPAGIQCALVQCE